MVTVTVLKSVPEYNSPLVLGYQLNLGLRADDKLGNVRYIRRRWPTITTAIAKGGSLLSI